MKNGKCVQCAVMLSILKALDIDVGTPAECDEKPNVSELEGLLSRKEVMSLLNIAKCTYTRWIEQGILVPRIFGKRHFFSEADLGRAMKESIRKGKR
ncbi:helix-turn-helix domain-containing protein [Sphingobacterium sp. FBM7-1]|uniref:helix-turn-helix domain-containing protein n=1 Tax=Sphingobacterium sp. FBM7-1 TaxID=2886688 RepID=UPI001D0FA95F|nr:helix-turn-helix domain-containing protein [Sphingobacterium sp. FBM7-1]MCC2599681.1 helix-turn-helix domain-containing protein [Sphingobacterium sp. FBM7-1]